MACYADLAMEQREIHAIRLRQARRSAGLKQYELAAKAGCHSSLIGLIETAHPAGRTGTAARERIAAALGCEVSELFPSTPDPEAITASGP